MAVSWLLDWLHRDSYRDAINFPAPKCPNMVASILRPVCDWQSRHIGMVNGVLTTILVVVKCTRMEVGEPSSSPTHMLVAEVVGGEDDRVTSCWWAFSWPTHSLSWVQVLCERGRAVVGGVPHGDVPLSWLPSHHTCQPACSRIVAVHICSELVSSTEGVLHWWSNSSQMGLKGCSQGLNYRKWQVCWQTTLDTLLLVGKNMFRIPPEPPILQCFESLPGPILLKHLVGPQHHLSPSLSTTLTGTIAHLSCVGGWAHFMAFTCCQREQVEGD